MQVATAASLSEVIEKGFITPHDTVDFMAPLALALICQPSMEKEVCYTPHMEIPCLKHTNGARKCDTEIVVLL